MTRKNNRFSRWFVRVAAWVRMVRGQRTDLPVPEQVVSTEPVAPKADDTQPIARKTKKAKPRTTPKPAPLLKTPTCPHCKEPMVIKVARTGGNAGGNFWGCGDYPKCRGMRAMLAPIRK